MLDILTDFLGNWVSPFYYIAYWAAGLIGVLASNKMMRTEKRFFLKKPTIVGWCFMVCIVLAFILSFVKDNKQDRDAKAFQERYIKSQKDLAKADAKYTTKLEDIEKGLIRRDTIWFQQLNKWGLTIKDSVIVKKEGNPIIQMDSNPVTIDNNSNAKTLIFNVCNMGDAGADNTLIEIKSVSNKDLETATALFKTKHSFAASECYHIYLEFPLDEKQYFFIFKFTYKNGKKETVVNYETVKYNFNQKIFGLNPHDFSSLF